MENAHFEERISSLETSFRTILERLNAIESYPQDPLKEYMAHMEKMAQLHPCGPPPTSASNAPFTPPMAQHMPPNFDAYGAYREAPTIEAMLAHMIPYMGKCYTFRLNLLNEFVAFDPRHSPICTFVLSVLNYAPEIDSEAARRLLATLDIEVLYGSDTIGDVETQRLVLSTHEFAVEYTWENDVTLEMINDSVYMKDLLSAVSNAMKYNPSLEMYDELAKRIILVLAFKAASGDK